MHLSGTRFRIILLFTALIAPIVALGLFIGSFMSAASAFGTPLGYGMFYVNPNSVAVAEAAAAADTTAPDAAAPDAADAESSRLLTAIAEQPTAIWLLPEKYPTESVTASVTALLDSARAKGQMPVFVIYGIPNRDCGNHSSGGLTEAEYPGWVSAIASALTTQPAAVILEPDSLALATQCNVEDKRVAQISQAIDALSATPAVVYLDGGHSDWLTAPVMADLLERSGVDRVRGFATNVSNYNDTAQEHAYAEQVASLVGGSRYVIDTSRNGRGSTGEWCNPVGRALGTVPALVHNGSQDANLWIKQPGESDGTCNGGPAAGAWWPERALELARNAGW